MNQQPKRDKCRYHHVSLEGNGIQHYCNQGDTLAGPFNTLDSPITCEHCERYKSMFIEYPLTIDAIDLEDIEASPLYAEKIGLPCAVKLAGDKDPTTYMGIFLGELPYQLMASFREDVKTLKCRPLYNPAILVPELGRIVYGYESWWKTLESPDDFKEITAADIQSQWYVQMFQQMMKGAEASDS